MPTETFLQKQSAYSEAASKYTSVKAEADSLQAELDAYPDQLKSAEVGSQHRKEQLFRRRNKHKPQCFHCPECR